MIAKVKTIEPNTLKEDDDDFFFFTENMVKFCTKTYEFKRSEFSNVWWVGPEDYIFHISWLE